MGRPWTTPEQLQWLQARVGSFMVARQSGRVDRFFTTTFDAWFERFPLHYADLTLPAGTSETNNDEELQKAIRARKKQILNWFTWNTRSSRPTNGASPADNALINALHGLASQEPRKRAPQRVEAYIHLFHDKVKAIVDQALKGVFDPSQRLNIRRRTVSLLLSEESEEVHAQITAYIQKWKIDQEKSKQNAAMEKPSTTPAEFHAAIQHLPAYLKTACTAASEATGWPIFIATGGPNPIANGTLHMQNYYFGARSIAGNTFEESCANFQKTFGGPFGQHLRNCFRITAPSVCRERSLENPSLTSTSCTNPIRPLEEDAQDRAIAPQDQHRAIAPQDCYDNESDSDMEDVVPGHAVADISSTIAGPSQPVTSDADVSIAVLDGGANHIPISLSTHIMSSSSTTPAVQHTPAPQEVQHTPAPQDSQAPSSPIAHAFARMSFSVSTTEQSQPPPQTAIDDDLWSNIDPILRYESQPHPQDSSILLHHGLEGFRYNPGPSYTIDPPALLPPAPVRPTSTLLDSASPSTSMPLDAVLPTTPEPAPEHVMQLDEASNLSDAPGRTSSTQPPTVPTNPDISITCTPQPGHVTRASSTQPPTIPTKTATFMASLISDYTLLDVSRVGSGADDAARSNIAMMSESHGSHSQPLHMTSEPMRDDDAIDIDSPQPPHQPHATDSELPPIGAEGTVGDGRELSAAEKRAITRAKNKANKRPRWEYVAVEEAAGPEKYQKLADESTGRTLRTRSGSRI